MIINLHKIPVWLKAAVCLILLVITIAGCKKDTPQASNQTLDGSTIKFVLNDNFTFGVVYAALTSVSLQDSLAKPGPYTFLAPNNDAYALIHVAYPATMYSFAYVPPAVMLNTMRYNTLDGRISFKNIPLTENKPYKTHTGGNIYVSKYLDGTDTVTTINGVKLTSMDNPASNGFIQVMPKVMNPEIYPNAVAYLHSDTTLSLFAAALQRSGLDKSLLQGNDVYTLLAPSNNAFQRSGKLGTNLGVSTLDSILMADPVKLANLLKYHTIKGRYFDGDLFRYAKTNPTGIATLNTGKVIIGGDPGGFHTITFLGNGNQGIPSGIAVPLSYNPVTNNVNIPCGNAVVHIINQLLIP
ncbi:Uncaracterized surface protein containing fasciclin (FAS1) repeats [Mucilaginibacter pineti]|uniref:Uncaracterized surface protein containing fasciclin (FAS1) repeats n=1 Tax=Mucilaginibacter pineti TaxID=1391627 RepID=A0A1G6XI85_9SPHI|nr:fasciclin domain-containing protein [Mucilaginibacter pineti]SDD77954.1 Uncaracterized surface protein containing fasciclin (FAS1) repeats [Mucilaginibacter pineti]